MAIRWATEIKLRAERRVGEMLREMEKHPGAADGRPGPGRGKKTRSHPPTTFSPPTIKDLGVTKQQSADWQALARIPEPEFEARLAVAGAVQERLEGGGK